MAVAPLTGAYAGPTPRGLRAVDGNLIRLRATHPAATMVSAGMSGTSSEAVAAGATHVRVGTAVLGVRPRLG